MKLKLRESDNNSYNEIIQQLNDFGFESDDDINYDYYMNMGLVATFNMEYMEGYFSWNPDGNMVDIGSTYHNVNQFLDDVYKYSEYDTDKLILQGLIEKGFTVNGNKYIYDNNGTHAEYNYRNDEGFVEYTSYDGESDVMDNLNLYELIDELFM